MNISDSNVITAEPSQKVAGFPSGTASVNALANNYFQVVHCIEGAGSGTIKGSSTFRITEDSIKLMGTCVWPRYTSLTEELPYVEPIPLYNNPHVFSCNTTINKTVLVGGMVGSGTFLERIDWAGIALSAEDGIARVLVTPGIVKGFSGLKAGAVYSAGYDGQLCDAGDHPLAVHLGTALNDETLWFSGV